MSNNNNIMHQERTHTHTMRICHSSPRLYIYIFSSFILQFDFNCVFRLAVYIGDVSASCTSDAGISTIFLTSFLSAYERIGVQLQQTRCVCVCKIIWIFIYVYYVRMPTGALAFRSHLFLSLSLSCLLSDWDGAELIVSANVFMHTIRIA